MFCGNARAYDNDSFYHWMNDLDKAESFLEHTKIVTFVQADPHADKEMNNLCKDVEEEE